MAAPTPDRGGRTHGPETGPGPRPELRIGHGYDLHRLEPNGPGGTGRPLIVGGVRLEHDMGPVARSDGDALYHAVTDAVLGALGLPDIGELFPDTSEAHEGQDSADFLAKAVRLAEEAGYRPVNLDATVILERPKIKPVKGAMRANLARLLGLDESLVNVKGKTHERVDAVGEGRAIETHAVVLMARLG